MKKLLIAAVALCLTSSLLGVVRVAAAPTKVLFSFGKDGVEVSGAFPSAGLTRVGNVLFGTTADGGTDDRGTIFRITPQGQYAIVAAFAAPSGGRSPQGDLIAGPDGSLYGVTFGGGLSNFGTVFKVSPSGGLSYLHHFRGGQRGSGPRGPLALGMDGSLYGLTSSGGANNQGIIFKLAAGGTLSVLRSLNGATTGSSPENAGLSIDSSGNLYGAMSSGGKFGGGTIFKLAPDARLTILYNFEPGKGSAPYGGVIVDANGNLFGTTSTGVNASSCATVFKLAPNRVLSTLAVFSNLCTPAGRLVLDPLGNLYGTAAASGLCGNCGGAFTVSQAGKTTILHRFPNTPGGANPQGTLAFDANGNLFGTTYRGGEFGFGTVYRIFLR